MSPGRALRVAGSGEHQGVAAWLATLRLAVSEHAASAGFTYRSLACADAASTQDEASGSAAPSKRRVTRGTD